MGTSTRPLLGGLNLLKAIIFRLFFQYLTPLLFRVLLSLHFRFLSCLPPAAQFSPRSHQDLHFAAWWQPNPGRRPLFFNQVHASKGRARALVGRDEDPRPQAEGGQASIQARASGDDRARSSLGSSQRPSGSCGASSEMPFHHSLPFPLRTSPGGEKPRGGRGCLGWNSQILGPLLPAPLGPWEIGYLCISCTRDFITAKCIRRRYPPGTPWAR